MAVVAVLAGLCVLAAIFLVWLMNKQGTNSTLRKNCPSCAAGTRGCPHRRGSRCDECEALHQRHLAVECSHLFDRDGDSAMRRRFREAVGSPQKRYDELVEQLLAGTRAGDKRAEAFLRKVVLDPELHPSPPRLCGPPVPFISHILRALTLHGQEEDNKDLLGVLMDDPEQRKYYSPFFDEPQQSFLSDILPWLSRAGGREFLLAELERGVRSKTRWREEESWDLLFELATRETYFGAKMEDHELRWLADLAREVARKGSRPWYLEKASRLHPDKGR